jgi:putative transposase
MIRSMPTTGRPQQRYDHRLQHLVHRTGDVTLATKLGVPRSTARGWLGRAPTAVVCLDMTNLTAPELRQEVVKLRRRVQKLTALLRLVLAVLRASGFRLTAERLPDGRDKTRILRAVDRARPFVPLRILLRFLRVSPSRFHAWRRRQQACALDDQSSCPRTLPSRLTPPDVRAIQAMVTSPDYRHVPTGTLAVLAQRLGTVWASPSTWYRLVRQHGWRRPRLRVHPVKPKIGLRTTRANEMWHFDTTVIRLLDGTRAYLHAVIDNFSRRIMAWRVADTFAPVNSVTVLLDASRAATPSETTPVVLADAGVENVNAQVDDLITTGVLRRVLAFTELKFSNSMPRSVVALAETSVALPPLARQPPKNLAVFRFRLMPGFAALCRSLLLPKGKKRATSQLKPQGGDHHAIRRARSNESAFSSDVSKLY